MILHYLGKASKLSCYDTMTSPRGHSGSRALGSIKLKGTVFPPLARAVNDSSRQYFVVRKSFLCCFIYTSNVFVLIYGFFLGNAKQKMRVECSVIQIITNRKRKWTASKVTENHIISHVNMLNIYLCSIFLANSVLHKVGLASAY